ncbi:sigma-E factor negative regulatory protein [Bordetella trematum]|uniref:sigma-E factor negative regulatory protein n=1 Tax=Bordetella trematum TaxID=123899 RepID=UPI000470E9E2|nr:sigma-E factor negative regulatory protein [Bordetella trematum]
MQTAAKSVIAEASFEELVSAWMDGEGSDDIINELVSEPGRKAWDTYHLIGDALRSSDLVIEPSEGFQARLSRALDAELPIVAAPKRRSPLRLGLSSLAVAAAVATVAWVAQPYLGSTDTVSAPILADASRDERGLGDYLEAHRQMAGPSAVRQVSFETGVR